MSAAAAMQAVLSMLREGDRAFAEPRLDYTNSGIEIEGRPPPRAPTQYVAVDYVGSDNPGDPRQGHLHEQFSILVVLSFRKGFLAEDRRESIYLKETRSLERLERQAIRAVSGNEKFLSLANGFLLEGEIEFTQILFWRQSRNFVLNASWSNEEDDEEAEAGWIVRKMLFVGGDRYQENYRIA